ncbi:HisA/HisF-related TIM barrel protein [Candidatus Poriferisodalis sp.]|uniref:1-(5-phosphoribosyl)-5-[(5- phosphoribosylamino)methylideneamino]imidazole-4- carboxamide isomerase n=1 Tax=Candidatus Poriferisodalis sp. TaxID=3101277 RepID=UPI003B52F143
MSFELYPAIDLREGRCVRLLQGDYDREVRYDANPVEVAHEFAEAGARWIHMVDLDAALSGVVDSSNRDVIRSVVAAIGDAGVRVQCGGGVRGRASAEALFDAGVTRCVVGTAAIENPDLVGELIAAGHRVAVGLDVRGTEVATRGWKHRSGVSLSEALTRLAGSGAEAVVVTQISRDGMGGGSDLSGLRNVLDAPQRPPAMSIIASGGVGCLADIADLRDLRSANGHTLAGAIVGKALHDGAISPGAAVVVARGSAAHDEPIPEAGQS